MDESDDSVEIESDDDLIDTAEERYTLGKYDRMGAVEEGDDEDPERDDVTVAGEHDEDALPEDPTDGADNYDPDAEGAADDDDSAHNSDDHSDREDSTVAKDKNRKHTVRSGISGKHRRAVSVGSESEAEKDLYAGRNAVDMDRNDETSANTVLNRGQNAGGRQIKTTIANNAKAKRAASRDRDGDADSDAESVATDVSADDQDLGLIDTGDIEDAVDIGELEDAVKYAEDAALEPSVQFSALESLLPRKMNQQRKRIVVVNAVGANSGRVQMTSDRLQKYEAVEIASIRCEQIAKHSNVMMKGAPDDPIQAAYAELYARRTPLILRRTLGTKVDADGTVTEFVEDIDPKQMELPIV